MGGRSSVPSIEAPDIFRTREEVAKRYRTSPATVAYWAHTGYLRGIRVGRRMLYPESLLAEFEQQRLVEAQAS